MVFARESSFVSLGDFVRFLAVSDFRRIHSKGQPSVGLVGCRIYRMGTTRCTRWIRSEVSPFDEESGAVIDDQLTDGQFGNRFPTQKITEHGTEAFSPASLLRRSF